MILGDIYHPVHPYTWRQAGCASLCILICSETSKRNIRSSFWSSERKNEQCRQQLSISGIFNSVHLNYMWYVWYISVHPQRSRDLQCSSICNRSALRSFGFSCKYAVFFLQGKKFLDSQPGPQFFKNCQKRKKSGNPLPATWGLRAPGTTDWFFDRETQN